jgi:hypothetical protein
MASKGCRGHVRPARNAPLIDMTKALFATAMLALVGALALAPTTAAGPGVCAGICVEVTKTEVTTTTVTEIHNNVQTCAGNVNVQVGVENEANYCTGNQTNGDHGFY